MDSLNSNKGLPVDKLAQLEAENDALRTEIKQLRSDNEAALFKLENQIAKEKEFEESQSRFETIFHKSKLGNKIIGPDLRILQINEVMQVMLGYTEEEIIGTKIITFSHPDFINHWHELQKNLWEKQIPSFQLETCLIKKNGSVLWVQVTSILFRDNGATLGYTIMEDISKRKALEQNLKMLYEKQETIMHMVAHDLKNPLHIIKLSSEFLKEKLEILDTGDQGIQDDTPNYLNIISDTCDKSLTIIEDLLLIGRIEASYGSLEQTELKSFVQSQVNILEVDARNKNIQVNFHFPEDSVYAPINQDNMKRVLDNLFSNAIKFTNQGGLINISLRENDQTVTLQVSDNGIGIPEKLKANIFEKFNKSGRTGTAGETTTGLGLYIVKIIIENHNGKIWLESEENTGTSFYIELPKNVL